MFGDALRRVILLRRISAMGISNRRTRAKALRVEHLEDRRVLAATPIITEFMASNSSTLLDGDGESSDWIEIYNPTGGPIDLAGWRLTDDAANRTKWTFPSTTIGAGQYLVVFASDKTVPNYIDSLGYRHTTYALSAGGEYLGLVDPTGEIASEFAPQFPGQSQDVSYGLNGAGLGTYFAHATPGAANDLASAVSRGVVISEIMYHPSSELTSEEYVEIYNGEAAAVNLAGWTLSGGVDFVLPARSLAPGQSLVIAANTAAFAAKYPTVTNVVGGWEGKLSNRGELIQLNDNTGRQVDSVAYFDEGDWSARELGPLDHLHRGWIWSNAADGGGSSLELVSFGLSNDFGQNWRASTVAGGTPGAVNSTHDADNNVAPLVLDVTQFPIIPRSTDPVTITARLLDELSVGLSATLSWRVDGTATFTAAVMSDNGVGPDATAGDQVFSAQLPAMANGTIVEFYVQSADQAGNVRTYPSATAPSGQQLTNLLYQVDNSFNPAVLPGPNDPPEYRLIMTNAERAELAEIGSTSAARYSHARMNGTFISVTASGVEVRYQVGIRNRGQGSSIKLPNSYHVDLPRDDAWRGLEAFNLNTQYTNLQLAGLRLFQASGAVAEDSQAVKVRVNGTDLSTPGAPSYGVYVQMEASDSVFAANHYPEDDGGNLYKAVRDDQSNARADFRDLGSDPAAYATYYEKQTNSSEADYSDLIELITVLNHEPDATYYDRLRQIVDVDQWLGYFATVAILSSEETSLATGEGDDYLLYRGENDPRFQLIPHDMDTIFGQGDTSSSPTSSIYRASELPALARFFNDVHIRPAYHEKLRSLLTTTFAKANLDPLLDQLLTGFTPAAQIAAMKTFMDARRTYILGLVDQALSVQAQLPMVGGFPHSTQTNVALSGVAPLAETRSVTAGGLLASYNPSTGAWSLGQSSGGATTNFIRSGDVWQYLDAGQVPSTTPGADWRVDDPGWAKSGPSKLGYGDAQATVVQYVDTNLSQSGVQKNITTYFRKTFNVANAASYTSLTLRLLRDDGAVVYLNGEEVKRSNMQEGIPISSTTVALDAVSGSEEVAFFEFPLDPTKLHDGQNVIAVEIHQNSDSSSDLGFDLELSGTAGEPNSTGGAPLTPGVNRVEVKAFDGPAGTGNVLESTYIDVWYDDGGVQNLAGTITAPTVLMAAAGPYVVTGDLFVEGAGVLTIQPGTTLFFNSGTGLTVRNGGRLVAEGTATSRIRFAHNPAGGGSSWDGLTFTNTMQDNRLAYIDMQSGDASGNALLVNSARLLVDHASWLGVNNQVLDLAHPTMIVSNSIIPGISGDETIHLFGLNQGEQLVFENNVVGFNSSGGDVIDLGHDTLTPGMIVFRGNTFLGGGDDGIDTDGFPVLIENNSFQNFHKDTSRATTSNAVSSGHMNVSGQTISSNLTLRNNTFFNNDHHLLLKDLSFATLTNNTMVDATLSAIHFAEPGGSDVIGPGRGANIDGNIFWGTGLVLESNSAQTELTLNRTIVPASLVGLGVGNIAADPLLVDPAGGDFSLRRESPALRSGPNGTDMGAVQTPRYTPASAANLHVTEVHYHALDGNKAGGEIGGDANFFEFIELKNTSNATIDLTDVAFDDGIEFTFPWLASLGAGEVLVLAKSRDLFQSRYGTSIPLAGEYAGGFSSDGEHVRLLDASGGIISEFTYDDAAPWPAAADGGGPSLENINPLGNPNSPSNWRASDAVGGTPGVVPTPGSADFDADGDVDGGDFLRWQRGLGKPAAVAGDGDADLDADVDGIDLAIWRNQFGASAAAAAESASSVESAAAAAMKAAAPQPGDGVTGLRAQAVDAAMAASLASRRPAPAERTAWLKEARAIGRVSQLAAPRSGSLLAWDVVDDARPISRRTAAAGERGDAREAALEDAVDCALAVDSQ
jgi:spore coat protein CotH